MFVITEKYIDWRQGYEINSNLKKKTGRNETNNRDSPSKNTEKEAAKTQIVIIMGQYWRNDGI
jgi:hypothetical protein